VARVRLPPDFLGQLATLRSTPIVVGHFFYPMTRLLPDRSIATVVRDPVERAISVWEYLHWQTDHHDHQRLVSRDIRTIEQFAEDDFLAGHVRDNQTRLLGVEYDVEAIADALQAGDLELADANRLAAESESVPADAAMLERAKRRLKRMAVVGITEELAEFVRRLELALGLPPGSPVETDNATPAATVARRPHAYDESTRRRLIELNPFDAELHAFARELRLGEAMRAEGAKDA
jgi:hypothetical protein